MSKSVIRERISALRDVMQANDISAIVVPSADPHLSEYLPEYWQGRQWLSGFTGSVGTLVVTADFAGLWADSRYWVQAADQLADTGIELQKLQKGQPNHADWLAAHLSAGDNVAIDGNVLSLSEQDRLLDAFEEAAGDDDGIRLITEHDLLTQIWDGRPALPNAPLYPHDAQFISQSAKDKLAAVRQQMAEIGATHHLISSLDDIAWLTNLRGSDVDYNPVFLAHMLISADKATLFVDSTKVGKDVAALLAEAGIEVAEYDQAQAALSALTPADLLLLDPNKVAVGTLNELGDDIAMIEQIAPSSLLKSVKSDQDIEHVREAMRQDGAALCQFFSAFEARLNQGERLSELDVDSMLIDVRSKQPHYVSPSFPTIAGFNENGALPHYRATEEKFSYLDSDGLLLIDSGAQYQNGTTDITRVVGIGQVNEAQKRDFSIVLKAHIALAKACFPDGIASPLIDAICRAPLWQAQMDYGHGTGHGVGYFLNVHEGPQVIAYAASNPPERAMKAGMISSNEPGLYREGRWGVRIENLVVNQPVVNPAETEFGDYLNFETVTLCPIDTRLVDKSVLNQDEIDWLNDYHSHVFNELKDRVEGEALNWLTERTQAI